MNPSHMQWQIIICKNINFRAPGVILVTTADFIVGRKDKPLQNLGVETGDWHDPSTMGEIGIFHRHYKTVEAHHAERMRML